VERHVFGKEAEDAAAQFMESEGFTVRARNVRCMGGELDLVVERGNLICFVEVRMRSSVDWGDPSLTVGRTKQQRVVRSAMRFLASERIAERNIRFDVITVVGRGPFARLEHIPNAFDAGW
jgi:putative endonuclease